MPNRHMQRLLRLRNRSPRPRRRKAVVKRRIKARRPSLKVADADTKVRQEAIARNSWLYPHLNCVRLSIFASSSSIPNPGASVSAKCAFSAAGGVFSKW